jgi:hypothetical protein
VVGGKVDASFERGIKSSSRRRVKEALTLGEEISRVELLRQDKDASRSVAFDGDVEYPVKLALVFDRESLRQVLHKTFTQGGVVVDYQCIVDVDEHTQKMPGVCARIAEEAHIHG